MEAPPTLDVLSSIEETERWNIWMMFMGPNQSELNHILIRHDICHHKQCLCKIISAPEKNLFSVNSKTFVVLLEELVLYVKKMQILKELWCLDAEIGVF